MVRARLWPASAQRPHLAFTFELLDWAEVLLLECQVALKDLCKALHLKHPHLVTKVDTCASTCIELMLMGLPVTEKRLLFIADRCF